MCLMGEEGVIFRIRPTMKDCLNKECRIIMGFLSVQKVIVMRANLNTGVLMEKAISAHMKMASKLTKRNIGDHSKTTRNMAKAYKNQQITIFKDNSNMMKR